MARARPGGNLTGMTVLSPQLAGKRLQLLRDSFPDLTRVGFLWTSGIAGATAERQALETAGVELGLEQRWLDVRSAADVERVFQVAVAEQVQALVVFNSAALGESRIQVLSLAQQHRLPAMYSFRRWVDAGGLMSYAPDLGEVWRQLATYVARILGGAGPADLPVQQPAKFEFVVNLKTAQALGRAIPPSVLVQATEVIQ